MPRCVTVITGVMASGKSTVAEAVAKRLDPSVHLRGGWFRRMIVSGRADMADPPSPEALRQLDLRHDLTALAARTYWQNGFHVVAQDNIIGDKLTHLLRRLDGVPARVVVLCPSLEAIRRREAERGKKGYVAFDAAWMREYFMRETPRLGLWLDSSDLSVEETARRVLDYISA